MTTRWDDPSAYRGLPGADLVVQGLRDLASGTVTAESLLVLVAGPALRRLGIAVPVPSEIQPPFEHRLYELLGKSLGNEAHARYNSMIRRVVSFTRAVERERAAARFSGEASGTPRDGQTTLENDSED